MDATILELNIKYDVSTQAKLLLLTNELVPLAEKYAIVNGDGGQPNFKLNVSNVATAKTANERIRHVIQIESKINKEFAEKPLFGLEDNMVLDSGTVSLAAEGTRYRELGEMDIEPGTDTQLTLEAFDNMALGEIDFIVRKL